MGPIVPEETRRGLIIALVIFLLILAFFFIMMVGLPLLEKAGPVITVTFDTIANHEDEKVSIQGRLSPGRSVSASNSCNCSGGWCSNLDLLPLETEGTDSIFDDLEVYVEMKSTDSAEPGHFYLPYSYTYDDLKIFTSDGQVLGYKDAIKVIGTVEYVVDLYGTTSVKICPYKILAGERD